MPTDCSYQPKELSDAQLLRLYEEGKSFAKDVRFGYVLGPVFLHAGIRFTRLSDGLIQCRVPWTPSARP